VQGLKLKPHDSRQIIMLITGLTLSLLNVVVLFQVFYTQHAIIVMYDV